MFIHVKLSNCSFSKFKTYVFVKSFSRNSTRLLMLVKLIISVKPRKHLFFNLFAYICTFNSG